jgi:hypothetical protein
MLEIGRKIAVLQLLDTASNAHLIANLETVTELQRLQRVHDLVTSGMEGITPQSPFTC